jgi:CubicO group peptidase (beta-lactamase class C family)
MLTRLVLALMLIGAAAPPTPAPLAHVFTAAMERRLDDLGAGFIRDHRTPGLGICVVEDGRIVYAHGFGRANLARNQQFEPGTQFYVGSISKQFTAAAILLLAQDGKLKLDDKVTKYVPELTVAGNATIAQLLDQTAGLPDYTKATGIKIDPMHTMKLGDLIAAVDKMPPSSAPGAVFAYNNFNYMMAGLVVERASGVTLSDYLQQHIFLPLVMNQSFYAGDNGISSTHAAGYTGPPGRFTLAPAEDPAWLFGAGGLVTTMYDLAKWDIGLPLLLRVDAERAMFTPSGAPGAQQYGYGWVIDSRDGKRYIWHNGLISGYHAMNALLPDDHVAVIVFANVDTFASAAVAQPESIAANVLDVVLPPSAVRVDNAVIEKAREWLERIADKRIDRTQLTPAFSTLLSDDLVARSNFAALGKVEALVPIASTAAGKGETTYEFLVRFAHAQEHYKITITSDGKIDGLGLSP